MKARAIKYDSTLLAAVQGAGGNIALELYANVVLHFGGSC